MKRRPFFRESNAWWRKGYFIPVRNSWNYHLDSKYLTQEEKELYEKKFGQEIISDLEFDKWYIALKK